MRARSNILPEAHPGHAGPPVDGATPEPLLRRMLWSAIAPVTGDIRATVVGGLVTAAIIGVFLLVDPERIQHWFIAPLFVCGLLVLPDAVEWFRGRVGVLNPAALLGMLGGYHFVVAPLLHIVTGYWLANMRLAYTDWRPWLGRMAILNAAGLLLYRVVVGTMKSRRLRPMRTFWTVKPTIFIPAALGLLAISGILQVIVLSRFGGIAGYVQSFEHEQGAAFQGFGTLFTVSESFPVLLLILLVWVFRERPAFRSYVSIFAVLFVFSVLRFVYFGGLRGSRSNTVWALFWAVGIIHLCVRRVPRSALVMGLVVLVAFMYFYGFYKSVGSESLEAFQSSSARDYLQQETGRTLEKVFLLDLARADVQAYALYKLTSAGQNAALAYGQTYARAILAVVPRFLWPARPGTKQEFTTNLLWYSGAYIPGRQESTMIFGLAGEAMLNFGPLAVPFSFVLLGLLVGWASRLYNRVPEGDVRLYLVPLFILLSFVALILDLDNLVFIAVKNAAMPSLLVLLSVRVSPIERQAEPAGY